MNKILNPSFWLQMFLSTFLTMLMIYVIKQIGSKWNIPVVSEVSNAV